MDEEFRGDVLIELEGECVFPFILHTLIAGEAIHARLPRDVLGHLPREIDDELRTEVGERMVVGFDTMSGGEPLDVLAVHEDGAVYVAIVHSQRRDVHRSREFLVEPLHLVVHTETHVQVEGRHEVGISALVVRLQAARELRVGQQLQRVVPMLGGLQTHLRRQTDEVFVGLELVDRI